MFPIWSLDLQTPTQCLLAFIAYFQVLNSRSHLRFLNQGLWKREVSVTARLFKTWHPSVLLEGMVSDTSFQRAGSGRHSSGPSSGPMNSQWMQEGKDGMKGDRRTRGRAREAKCCRQPRSSNASVFLRASQNPLLGKLKNWQKEDCPKKRISTSWQLPVLAPEGGGGQCSPEAYPSPWVHTEWVAGSPVITPWLHWTLFGTECSSKSHSQVLSDEDMIQVQGCARQKEKSIASECLPSFYR